MIKINTQTLKTERVQMPKRLMGLTTSTLTNLQAELNPVPKQLINLEWWPEELSNPHIDTNTQKYGAEILTPDVDRKVVVVSHEVLELTSEEISEIVTAKQEELQAQNKTACRKHILNSYNADIQRSAALGVYPSTVIDPMSEFITACIAEENRVFDLLEAATTIPEIETIQAGLTWPEV